MTQPKELQLGKKLPLMEAFYTIQGEGFHTGKASYFLRIGGCDVGCSWCDVKESWNPDFHELTDVEDIVSKIDNTKVNTVVITGGEPLNYNLDLLCILLKKKNLQIHLETSGTCDISGHFDWICLSPKKQHPPLKQFYEIANELKVIIQNEEDIAWAVENAKKVEDNCLLYLQPEWSRMDNIMQTIVDFVLDNPEWKISLQTHKFMKIP